MPSELARFNPASIARQLQALGFTLSGAQQVLAGQVVSDQRDRQRLALVLTRLLGEQAVQVAVQGGHARLVTQSGVVIELSDDA